jgi:hypothetical protein
MKTQKQGRGGGGGGEPIVTNNAHQHGAQVDKNEYLMFILSKDSFFSLTTY